MNTILRKLFVFSLVLLCTWADAQAQAADCDPDAPKVRYRSRDYFTSFQTDLDKVYWDDGGFFFPTRYELDVYYPPASDTETERPLIVWAHPGGFITGDKATEGAVLWCETLAKMGYVVASINYRQDLAGTISNALANFAGIEAGTVRGVYIAVQDGRSAIRWLRSQHMTYGIDLDRIYMAGSSAGSVMTLYTVYMEEAERPPQTYPVGLFLGDLGCIDCGENAEEDNSMYNGDVQGGVAMWGAVQDVSVIDDKTDADGDGQTDDEPVLFLHGADDDVVLPDTGPPFQSFGIVSGLLPDLSGTYEMRARLDALGADAPEWEAYVLCKEKHEFELDEQDGSNGEFGTGMEDENYDYTFNESVDHFYSIIDPTMPQTGDLETLDEDLSALALDNCDNTSKGTYAPLAYSTYRVSSPNPGSSYCWDITKGNILTGAGTPEITVRWSDAPNNGATIDDAVGRTGTILCYETTAAGDIYKASTLLVTIEDGPATSPVANFTSTSSGTSTFNFTDASTNADHPTDNYEWDFGDGTTMIGTTANPTHTYAMVGTYTVKLTVRNQCGSRSDYEETVTVSGVTVAPKVYLQGPYTGTDMTTALNAAALIPPNEPYTALGFAGLQNAGTGFAASFVPGTGGDEMTDWVVVELRDAATPTTVIDSRAAILQKDGDVVDIDGMSPVGFIGATPGMYHIVVRHRNHLGVMTGMPVNLN